MGLKIRCTDSPHVPIQTSTVSPTSLPFAWILLLKEIWAILAVKPRTKLHLGMAPTPRKKHAICNISCNTIVKWLALPHYNYKHDLFGRSSNIDGVLAQQKRGWFCDKALLPKLGYWIEKNGLCRTSDNCNENVSWCVLILIGGKPCSRYEPPPTDWGWFWPAVDHPVQNEAHACNPSCA